MVEAFSFNRIGKVLEPNRGSQKSPGAIINNAKRWPQEVADTTAGMQEVEQRMEQLPRDVCHKSSRPDQFIKQQLTKALSNRSTCCFFPSSPRCSRSNGLSVR